MLRRYREIWYALLAIVAVTALYALVVQQQGALPAAASLVGHGIGVLGIVLMLMAETLYSIRKRSASATLGSTAGWLRFHIFTGLVGPYMVLLHSAMRFRGLAGVSLLLTGVVVVSGAIGRYVYTAAPHTTATATADPGGGTVATSPSAARSTLSVWRSVHVPLTWAMFATAFAHAGAALLYATLQR